MPITIDDSGLLAGLARLQALIPQGAERGLTDAAVVDTDIMQTSPAHGDHSGAAHASSKAVVIGGTNAAQAELDQAYAIAQEKLSAFAGHTGEAAHVNAPTLPADQRGILYARPINYAADLEQSGRAVVEPTLRETAEFNTRMAAEGIKAVLG